MNCNKSSSKKPSFNENEKKVIKDNKKDKITYKNLEDNKRRIQLKIEKQIFKPI